jgi:hypothetical protein
MTEPTDFPDDCFAVATTCLARIEESVREAFDRPPSRKELAELLTWAAWECNVALTSDTANRDLVFAITSQKRRKRVALVRGDIITVPYRRGAWFAVVYLGSYGRFGHAVGVFAGPAPLDALVDLVRYPKAPISVFVDPDPIALGQWNVIGKDPPAAELYPPPALLHDPRDNLGTTSYGEFGLAEHPDGSLRFLTKAEADINGIADGTYQHSFDAKSLEQFLAARLKALRESAPPGS